MNKSILILVLCVLLFVLLFGLNSSDPMDPLIHPKQYVDEVIKNYKNFYK